MLASHWSCCFVYLAETMVNRLVSPSNLSSLAISRSSPTSHSVYTKRSSRTCNPDRDRRPRSARTYGGVQCAVSLQQEREV